MGSGKTTIGKKLAKLMGLRFVDTDRMLTEKHEMEIVDFFNKYGEESFREEETKMLKDALLNDNVIVATGGGTPCYGDNMLTIVRGGLSIYIKSNPKTLHERVSYKPGKRPMLDKMDSEEMYYFICQQIKEREIYYSQAHITLRGEGLKPTSVRDSIEAYFNNKINSYLSLNS